jgi:hypothetical protein
MPMTKIAENLYLYEVPLYCGLSHRLVSTTPDLENYRNPHTNPPEMALVVAKTLTRWMNGKSQEAPVWSSLPEAVQAAYLVQAEDALFAMQILKN